MKDHDLNVTAYVSSLKALVTQASSAIPVMPLYISLIYKVMKEEGTHEGRIEQIFGLFENLLVDNPATDEANRLRMDGKRNLMMQHRQKSKHCGSGHSGTSTS